VPEPRPTQNPIQVRLQGLASSLISQSSSLATSTASPQFESPSWRNATLNAAKEVEGISGAISIISPPACLSQAYGLLRAAGIQVSTASGFIVSSVDASDPELMQQGRERLAAGRAALATVPAALAAASC
jgi:hypothetical protein